MAWNIPAFFPPAVLTSYTERKWILERMLYLSRLWHFLLRKYQLSRKMQPMLGYIKNIVKELFVNEKWIN